MRELLGQMDGCVLLYFGNDGEAKTASIAAVPVEELVLASGDLDIYDLEIMDGIRIDSDIQGSGEIKIILSFDGGETWFAYADDDWVEVDVKNMSDVAVKAMPVADVSLIPGDAIEELRDGSSTLRFGYYLSIEDTSDVADVDTLRLVGDMFGMWEQGHACRVFLFLQQQQNDRMAKG